MKLHLGCANRPVPGWVNTDISPNVLVARIPGAARMIHRLGRISDGRLDEHNRGIWRDVRWLDVSKRFPFPSKSVDAVFSSHLLEHLPPATAENCLRESYRVLAPSGVMRIGVPDLDLFVDEYDRANPDIFVARVFETGQSGSKNRHWWMYNEGSLTRALQGAGFSAISRRRYREGVCPDLELLDNRPEVTLYMEAMR